MVGHFERDWWHVQYHRALGGAVFCGAFPGDGWSGGISSAVFAGCIPVIFDGSGEIGREHKGGMTGIVREPTRWAWRQPELMARVSHSHQAEFRRRANYSEFAVKYFAADLTQGKQPRLVKQLLALATKPEHAYEIAARRAAVGRVAPLMRWAPPPGVRCEVEPCDAFMALVMLVQAARRRLLADMADD